MVTKKVVKKVVKKTAKKKSVVGKIKTPKFVCYNCHNDVGEFDHQIILTTCEKGKVVQEVCFHQECWKEYFEKCVVNKSKAQVKKVQKKVMGLMDNPIVKSMLGNINGVDKIMAMVSMPLNEKSVDNISEELNNGKRETKPRKRKAKA